MYEYILIGASEEGMTNLQEQLDQHYERRLELDRQLRALAEGWRNFERAHPKLHIARASRQLGTDAREQQQHLRGPGGLLTRGRLGPGPCMGRGGGFRDPQQHEQQLRQQQREEEGDLARPDKQLEMATRVRHAIDQLEARVKGIFRQANAQLTCAAGRPVTRKRPSYESYSI